jgi:hypothetical protein
MLNTSSSPNLGQEMVCVGSSSSSIGSDWFDASVVADGFPDEGIVIKIDRGQLDVASRHSSMPSSSHHDTSRGELCIIHVVVRASVHLGSALLYHHAIEPPFETVAPFSTSGRFRGGSSILGRIHGQSSTEVKMFVLYSDIGSYLGDSNEFIHPFIKGVILPRLAWTVMSGK